MGKAMQNISLFDHTKDGQTVHVIDIASAQLKVRILTYGAILNDVRLVGADWPLTLGAPNIAAYEGRLSSFGALMGPVVNRIKGAQAVVDGQLYQFEKHHSGNLTQHSGSCGIHKQIWKILESGQDFVTLGLHLPDGQGGFPGNRDIKTTYRVEGAKLSMHVVATSDAPTPFNPANHSYWALDGQAGFCEHSLQVFADEYTEADSALMPTGRVLAVENTPYDFRQPRRLTGRKNEFFDLNLCLSPKTKEARPIAILTGAKGLEMQMFSTECGLQIFDCGTIDAPEYTTHHGAGYGLYAGLALEAQSWPGALDHGHFPSIILRPNKTYEQITAWAFS